MRRIFYIILFLSPVMVWAVLPDEVLSDAALEAEAREISRLLRCVVCQNQTIDESSAPLARDLRLLVRERLLLGESREDILRHISARYGDYVLLSPPFRLSTVLLWLSAPLLLLVGAIMLWFYYRGRLFGGNVSGEDD